MTFKRIVLLLSAAGGSSFLASPSLAQTSAGGSAGIRYGTYEIRAGGTEFDGHFYRLDGAYAHPLGESIGVQLNSTLTVSRNDVAGGDSEAGSVGATLFYRTEDFSLGAFAGAGNTWVEAPGQDQRQLGGGVTGNVYLGPVTLGAAYGWIDGRGASAKGAELTARVFPTERLMLEAEHSIIDLDIGALDFGTREWRLQGEFQPARWPVSLNAGYQRVSSDSFGTTADRFWVGLRVNFGHGDLRRRDLAGPSMTGFGGFLFLD